MTPVERILVAATFLTATCSGCAGGPEPKEQNGEQVSVSSRPAEATDDHSLSAIQNAAATIKKAWFFDPQSAQRVALSREEAHRIGAAVASCERSGGLALTPPPWPGTFMEFEADNGRRYAFQLVVDRIRVNESEPYSSSVKGMFDDDIEVSAVDCSPSAEHADELWQIHRSHFGPTRRKEYRYLDF